MNFDELSVDTAAQDAEVNRVLALYPNLTHIDDGADDECVDCNGYVKRHDDNGCLDCGCTRSLFWDDDRGDE